MKKLLLTGAAFVAFAATPAMAEGLSLDLAGHFKGYGVYTDADTDNLREFNFRKDTEVHFTGETTLDSGLTVGVHVETGVDGDTVAADEAYMYASGGWGRVNFGEEDGAAYLLQVAAPSADSNVDGIRQFISASELDVALDYDNAIAEDANKLTYMSPVFNGFQAGATYTPTAENSADGVTATSTDNDAELGAGYELAARYEAEISGVGVTMGAGYSDYSGEISNADADAWNLGLGLGFGDVNVGAAYVKEEAEAGLTGLDAFGITDPLEVKTLVVGADYTMGAYKVGASWMNKELEIASGDAEGDRYTVGGSYAYGPGMSFRGSISHIDSNDVDFDETQVLVGTQVNF